ncbi:menaquinone-dependent protoporphyrinogen IX dehydrogenase [Histophilus somni]|uniref:menaquinone-dependent protoporphyrinogen IX dehydrogenase n=1 Tax=Histophilus somni TaxID=731 RepID=UPI00201E9A0D|nr:menaquinone-dependent protoporphyrinogen IX dehydrogenase [Histophilus somni]
MKTLILYLSREGQTKKIAEYIGTKFEKSAVQSLLDFSSDLATFDRIIIGASVRYGHFDQRLYQFLQKNTALLQQKESSFFGVNLTARKENKNTPETNVYVRKFLQRIRWKPKYVGVFAGALFYPRYSWFDRMMIRLIMKITGGETDVSKEIEYTDWEKVDDFVLKIRQGE